MFRTFSSIMDYRPLGCCFPGLIAVLAHDRDALAPIAAGIDCPLRLLSLIEPVNSKLISYYSQLHSVKIKNKKNSQLFDVLEVRRPHEDPHPLDACVQFLPFYVLSPFRLFCKVF